MKTHTASIEAFTMPLQSAEQTAIPVCPMLKEQRDSPVLFLQKRISQFHSVLGSLAKIYFNGIR